jgi:hypothetical protein
VEAILKRLSTGALAAFFAACLGLSALVAFSGPAAAQGSKNPAAPGAHSAAKLVAQASAPAASSTMPPGPSVEPAASGNPPPLPGTPEPAMAPHPAKATAAPRPSMTMPPASSGAVPTEDFGTPPSSEVPILFNDHHVYTKPDRLHNSRVLAALVRGGSVLVPLRSMFEQMGATVSFDPETKTVDVMKPGSDVKVAIGKPEVIVNGESRPLDVPPEMYKGILLVPLRVLSEGMGAYVQWVPEKRTVVVRYLSASPPSPPPAPEPTQAPTQTPATPAPTAVPPPVKIKSKYERFVVGDYIFSPRSYNALSPGNTGSSFGVKLAVEFPLFNLPWMLEGDFRSFRYPHSSNGTGVCPSLDQTCVTAIGNQGQVYVPTFNARDDDFDGRFGLKVADPRIYIGIGYIFRNTNYEGGAFATQAHGIGFGAEKLPDLDEPFSIYGSAYYYPFVTTNGNQYLGGTAFGAVQYRILKYTIGGTFNFGNSPLYLDFGYLGDRVYNKQNAPIDEQHSGPYAGLGIHF